MIVVDSDIALCWLVSLEISAKSMRNYALSLATYMRFLEKRRASLESATAIDYKAFIGHINEHHRASVAVSICLAVKRFYEWAEADGWLYNITKNAAIATKWSPYSRKAITTDEARKVMSCARNERDFAMISLCIRGALRTRDIVEAERMGLILDGGSGEIRLSNGMWLPLTKECAQALNAYIETSPFKYPDEGRLFTAMRSKNIYKSISARTVREIIHAAFSEAGLSLSMGEYFVGSAALNLAIEEQEPLEVLFSLYTVTHHYYKQATPHS